MRIKVQIGVIIVSGLWTVVTLVIDVSGIATSLGYEVAWQWYSLGGFIIFIGFGGWWISDLYDHIHELEKKLPSIEVSAIKEHDDYYLEVKNIGGSGTFEAEVSITKSSDYIPPFLESYSVCWLKSGSKDTVIPNGLSDKIRIAKSVSHPPDFNRIHLDIYYFNTDDLKESKHSMSTYWVGSTLVHNGEETLVEPHYYMLHVVINAKEGLREGLFAKDYKLSLHGLEEVGEDALKLNS